MSFKVDINISLDHVGVKTALTQGLIRIDGSQQREQKK